jgi:hypothetical protein
LRELPKRSQERCQFLDSLEKPAPRGKVAVEIQRGRIRGALDLGIPRYFLNSRDMAIQGGEQKVTTI